MDPSAAVGARHHIVPKFLLKRFANSDERILVRDRSTGAVSVRNISDLAVRDFYTIVTKSHTLDASLELMLSEIEGAVAAILHTHLDAVAFMKPRAFTHDERLAIDTFVSMQYVRGMRMRRSLELVSDYGMKLVNQGSMTVDDIENLDVVPHSNAHLEMFGPASEKAFANLAPRPLMLIHLDRPLLVTGDEPVALSTEKPRPTVDPTRYPKVSGPNIRPEDVIQINSNRVGLLDADEVSLAVSPTAVLVYGQMDWTMDMPAGMRLNGKDAREAATEHNQLVLSSAVDWVAAHPDNTWLRELVMPPPVPLLTIVDGNSVLAQRTNANKVRRPIRRLRQSDVDEAQVHEF